MQEVIVDIIYFTVRQAGENQFHGIKQTNNELILRDKVHQRPKWSLRSEPGNRVPHTQRHLVLYSQEKVLVPHRVQRLGLDLSHLDAPGGQHLLGAGALLQLLLPLPEAELTLLLLLCLPWALAHQDSQHAVGVAVPWQARAPGNVSNPVFVCDSILKNCKCLQFCAHFLLISSIDGFLQFSSGQHVTKDGCSHRLHPWP